MLLTLTKQTDKKLHQIGFIIKAAPMIFKNFIDTSTFRDITMNRMITQYCNNNMNKHNTCSFATRFNKIAH